MTRTAQKAIEVAGLDLGDDVWARWCAVGLPQATDVASRKFALPTGRMAHGIIARIVWTEEQKRSANDFVRTFDSTALQASMFTDIYQMGLPS